MGDSVTSELMRPAPLGWRVPRLKLSWLVALEIVIAVVAVWLHVRKLASMPEGLYKDEVSFAWNAYTLATTGRDEYGVSFPLYPKAFGEYKSAGYVYLSVLVMRVVGLSSWSVRAPSVLSWLVGTALMYGLGRRLWPRPESRVFLLLLLAFTPSLFCLSRMAFESIMLYPTLALFLLGVQRGFEGKSARWAAIAGVAIGLSTYVYATFRLLAPLHCLLILLCYGRRQHLRSLVSFAAAAFVTVIPFAWYMHEHGDNLTKRYQLVGYAHQAIPLTDKLQMFVTRYVNYFTPQYLLTSGDDNLRQHTGNCGELLAPCVLALVLGIALFLGVRRFRRVPFHSVLLGGFFLSPISAALTLEQHHSLRAFSLVVFAIPIALYGFHHVLRKSRYVSALMLLATLLSAGSFVKYYFGPYRATTIAAFEYYGIREAIQKAVREQATSVVIDNRRGSRHADLYANFYSVVLGKHRRDALPPFRPGRPAEVKPGEYFVFDDKKNVFPELKEGLPAETWFVAAPYGPVTKKLATRVKR